MRTVAAFVLLLVTCRAAQATMYEFDASVDGRRVGTHRFEVEESSGEVRVHSVAQFTYRLLGVTLYRYRHEAREVWRDGCVISLESRTDDDGKPLEVRAARRDGVLVIESAGARTEARDCVHAFAYWSAGLLDASSLLNPQTGRLQAVTVSRLESAPLSVPGRGTVVAQRRRIEGEGLQIDVWHGADGEWLQLESTTPEKRVLRYARKSPAQ